MSNRRSRLQGELEIVPRTDGTGGDLIVAGEIRYLRAGIETPITAVLKKYTHVQNEAADTWTIEHNLATISPSVAVYDSLGRHVFAPYMIFNENKIEIQFVAATTGRAIIALK